MIDTDNTQIFQFTLGPVQGFVAQARRTRDFWAGSFILSWLSSVAIAAIQRQGGEVLFPVPDENYLEYLYVKHRDNSNKDASKSKFPQQGSIPNRFRAATAKVPLGFEPERVGKAVQDAWKALADAVWEQDLKAVSRQETKKIWNRQVANFWEISWVLSDKATSGNLLDRRKNWRNTVPPQEPGHKCMMMDGWQELSGVAETNLSEVDKFWNGLRQSGSPGIATDLRKGERLCAMAFIKRRFSRCFDTISVLLPGPAADATPNAQPGKPGYIPSHVHGWKLPHAVPSVSFLAAAPWLAEVIRNAPAEVFEDFYIAARELTGLNEKDHVGTDSAFSIDIRCVSEAVTERRADRLQRLWAGLDGQVYFPSALENPRIFGADMQPQARKVLQQLHKLRNAAGQKDLPSPYYAILLMDGDQLGKHMGDEDKQNPISQALNAFTQAVGDIVRAHNGFLIYAGGDDVLALLPLEDALPAAAALQAMYCDLFAQHSPKGKPIDSTLSGAIEYVHIRTPLTRVLQDAHKLLDDIAKEKTGRNAIAVRVWKPSGLALQWAMPWEKALDANGDVQIARLARDFAQQAAAADGERFSNKFFFRMQQILERFGEVEETKETKETNVVNEATLQKLLLAEYLHSWGGLDKRTGLDSGSLKKQLEQLLAQCHQWRREEAGGEAVPDKKSPFNPEAALLVRFLAQKGLDKE
ncbi:type III-B CRISPR-associated protein Cas10/Cmr2 [Lysobacteraceae bacterium NML95-0200]|nr:type III-B CRISPR-associated protein Cas10/Cmr2 [Xanthomonadaceae bacterium NML95-0200]